MKKFRLKKEAVPFFKEKHATSIYDSETWASLQVDTTALEEVKAPFIKYGHNSLKLKDVASLGGWDNEDGTKFFFTIQFPSVSFFENDKFSKGRVTRELMDRIQSRIDDFFVNFSDGDFNK